jgi:biopolymer transport protein ExbB
MEAHMGLAHFWQHGDAISRSVAVLLLLLSIASWTIILVKTIAHWRVRRGAGMIQRSFWGADSLNRAVAAIETADRSGIYAGLASVGTLATEAHARHAARGIGAGVSCSEFITRAFRNHIMESQARMETGLTFLASVGSTAPFIGLFGTVWGIYHALAGLAGSSQVILDRVAGPVGEALIMTAAGLFVAIPAVLAYNAFTRANRLTLACLDGFAHDLHAYLTTGLAPGGGDNLVSLEAARAARSA